MTATAELPRGVRLDGRYEIERLLATGGMGSVYVATHLLLKKKVAVKVLKSDLAEQSGMLERFQREAVAASAVGHAGIVQVTDMGLTSDGLAYMVMELLAGQSLGHVINTEAPMSPQRAARLACDILDAVGAAHAAGIVHRDLKPENVFVVDGERIKLLDFGISSFASADAPPMRLTSTGMIMGTPNYMSAEQARGDRDVTQAADLYAVGVILYEMLTAKLPYVADNYNRLMYQIVTGDHVRLSKVRPDLAPELTAVVERAMAVEPADRYASAREMMEALNHARTRLAPSTQIEVVDARALAMAETVPPTPSQLARQFSGPATVAAPARSGRLVAAVVVGAGLIAIAAFFLLRPPRATPFAPPTVPTTAPAPTPAFFPDATQSAAPTPDAARAVAPPDAAPSAKSVKRRPKPLPVTPTTTPPPDTGVIESSPYAPKAPKQ